MISDFNKLGSKNSLSKAFVLSSLAVSGIALAGSGGSSTSSRSIELQSHSTSLSTIFNISKKDSSSNDNKVSQQIDFIKKTFNLTDEELSKVCCVASRKTLSNWKESGQIPRENNRQRVFDLFLLAKDWNNQSLPNSKNVITKNILNGQSVLDILQENSLDNQKALFAGRRLLRESLNSNSFRLI